MFDRIEFLCYHTQEGKVVQKDIDLSKGYVIRLPKENEIGKPVYSMVIDCYK